MDIEPLTDAVGLLMACALAAPRFEAASNFERLAPQNGRDAARLGSPECARRWSARRLNLDRA